MANGENLSQRAENYVDELVRTGRYKSRGEALTEGLRLIEEREKQAVALDAALAAGIADMEAGRVKPLRDVAQRLIAKCQAMEKDSISGSSPLPTKRKPILSG